MRNFNKIAIILTLILTLPSCESLLDLEADGTISGDVLVDESALQQALIGAYFSLGGIADGGTGGELLGGDFVILTTLLTRQNGVEISWDRFNGSEFVNFIDKEITLTNSRVEANWIRGYEVINTVNTILDRASTFEASSDLSRIQGEALAIRGIIYFEMVRLWAPQYTADGVSPGTTNAIPILLDPITDVSEIVIPELSTIEQVYARAESDMLEAATLLEPLGANGTSISYYAVQAYLARLYMQKRDFDSALDPINAVLNSGIYSLASTPLDAFNNQENSSEDVFAIQQTTTSNAGDRATGTGLPNYYSSFTTSGLGVMRVRSSSLEASSFLINSPSFATNDLRGTIDLAVDNSSTINDIDAAFYRNLANNDDEILSPIKFSSSNQVIPVIRLAEMYLSRAEVIFESNPFIVDPAAVADLNTIRTRAGLDELAVSDFTSSFAFYDSLLLERNREFLYEGHLLNDLKRVGGDIGTDFNRSSAYDAKFVLPIPQSEIDAGTSVN